MGTRLIVTAKLSLPLAAAAMLCLIGSASAQVPPGPEKMPAPIPGPMQAVAPEHYAAKALQVTGRVSVLRDSMEYAVVEGGEVRVKEMIFTGADGQAHFQVSDGSTFDVYPNSRVIFRKNDMSFADLLDVLVGRVKIHIEHLGNTPNNKKILTPTAVISVRGTTFDVSVDDDDEATVVEVEEGMVEVQHALLGGTRVLTDGESLRVSRNEPIAANHLDKGEFFKRAARMAIDALNTWESRVPKVAGGGGSTGSAGGGVGDTKRPGPPTSTAGPPGVGAAPPPPPPPPGGVGFTNGHVVYVHSQQQPQTKWQKIRFVVVHTAMRFLLGTSPADEVIRVSGRM